MKEIWRDIPGFEGLYQASSLGSIRSLDRFVPNKTKKQVYKEGKANNFVLVYLLVAIAL